MSREPLSRIEKILSNIVGEGSYELDPPMSDAEEILQAILNDSSIDTVARDRICTILLCILNNEEYTGETLSRSEEILKYISQGEKYEVDEWIYEHDFSRVEQLLTDWANKEDPEYIKTVTGTIINVLDAVEKPAESLVVTMEPKQEATPFVGETTTEPYLSKTASTTGNKRYLDKIVGGTVCWNQLEPNSGKSGRITPNGGRTYADKILFNSFANHVIIYHFSAKYNGSTPLSSVYIQTATSPNAYAKRALPSVYLSDINDGKTVNFTFFSKPSRNWVGGRLGYSSSSNLSTTDTLDYDDLQYTDLTLMFSNAPAIANYIYSLEQATAGAGVQWLKDHGFIDDLYRAYNPGELISAKPTAFTVGGDTYALGGVDLRGLFKLDAQNNLYCDGDELTPDGVMTTKWELLKIDTLSFSRQQAGSKWIFTATIPNIKGATYNIENLTNISAYTETFYSDSWGMDKTYRVYGNPNTPNWGAIGFRDDTHTEVEDFLLTISNKYIVYPLRTPTTTSSETYPNPVDIENGGTEAFIDTRAIPLPVGNNSHYAGVYAIQGKTGLTVNHAQTQEDTPTVYSVTFTEQGTVYGGTMDIVSGELSVEWAEIASYAGETLPGRWMSSKDEYVAGTTPSTGAQVVYELAEPITRQLTPIQVTMLLGENTLWTEDGEITLTYAGTNPAMMMQALRVQNNLLKKPGLTPIEPLKPLDPIKPILKK